MFFLFFSIPFNSIHKVYYISPYALFLASISKMLYPFFFFFFLFVRTVQLVYHSIISVSININRNEHQSKFEVEVTPKSKRLQLSRSTERACHIICTTSYSRVMIKATMIA